MMKIVRILCLINVLAQCGSNSITLEVDKSNMEEKKQLTLTCSTEMAQEYMQFMYATSNTSHAGVAYLLYSTTSGTCLQYNVNTTVMSDCFCENSTRYICYTKPLTRNNSGDSFFCLGANSIKSNKVYISITVPIQSANILGDIREVIDTHEGGVVQLTCKAPFGIPAANISWFLDNKTKNTYDDDIDFSENMSLSFSKNIDRTYNTTSILRLNASRNEDGMAVYCNASNSESNVASSRTLIFNVRYKPKTGILINNNESYTDFYMIRNSPTIQSLQCDVRGGKPFANLTWSCYDGNQTNTNTSFGATSNITWIAGNHNESVCICKASHFLGWSDEREVYVHVLYPPSEPTCEVKTVTVSSGLVNVTLASNFTMTCTSNANPEPTIFIWCLPNGNCTKRNILFLPSMQIDNDGIYNLYIQNTMTPSIGDKMGGNRNATFSLRAHYHPKDISLHFENKNGPSIHNPRIEVIKDDNVTIACVADGYPTPNYTWTGNRVGQLYHRAFTGDTEIVCNASNTLYPTGHKMIEQNRITSAKLQVDVLYPPTYPKFQLIACTNKSVQNGSSIKVIIGEALNINCCASGNPPPDSFWSDGIQSSHLYIENVLNSHASEYFCTVNNTMNASYGKSVSSLMTSSFYLDVLKPPKITNFPTELEVLEGMNFSEICNAEPGNPNDTLYFWTSMQHPARNTSGQYLIIQNIARTDEGIFTCFAENIMHPTGCQEIRGSDNESVYVNVKYKASITTFMAENTTVSHGKNISFECGVKSDPPANITLVSPAGFILTKVIESYQLNYIKRSSCLEDNGQFTCVSANKYNRMQPDRRNVKVDVKCPPMYPLNYNQSTIKKITPGENAVFTFSVFSNPPPTNFTWTNISNSMRISIGTATSDRVIINATDEMSSALIITSVEPWDSGNYSVTVENEIGSMNETFRIVVENKWTENGPSTINITPNNRRNPSNIGAVIGGSVGAITGVVIIAVIVIIVFYTRIKNTKGTSQHDNNKLHLLQDTIHESGNMETNIDNVLPISDETPKYEEEKNIYGNVQIKEASGKSLAIKTLRDTVRQLKLNPVPLFKEFYGLQIGLQYDTKDALKPYNIAKNRYRSVYPYDASRVVLPLLIGDLDSDFINASFIDGYCKPRKYIAAQGPLENTINDTWRMIHSEDIKIIVMVTNLIETGKRKCVKYWPDDRATYGKCNVKLDQVEEYADFVVRHITYSMDGTRFERKLIQFHYTSWPDKNVPSTALSLVQFWRKVRQSEFVENTPWMVHCSAGVGRTGTFIALDYLYDQGKVDGKLNVPETVNVLREQRISMVQTKEQYLYLHEAITELLNPVGQIFTPENSLRLQSTATDERLLNKEFKAITKLLVNVKTDFEENDYELKRMPDGLLPENISKSINQTVIPDDLFRPLISTGNDFINAVYIPTYRDAEKYIVTQFPLQNTVVDFVRLLWYHNIQDVVLIDDGIEKLHCYWPHNNTPLCMGPFVISLSSVEEANNCTTRRIEISLAEKRQSKETVVHQFTAWPGYLNLCEPKSLTEFLQTISKIAGPVVVQCHDGYSRSGLFVALLSIVDRIKTDNEVAIADTVRVVKHRRQAAVTDEEQYQFCHEVVFEYLKGRDAQTEDKENQEYVNMTFPKFL